MSSSGKDTDYLDTVFKALGHITRRRILRLLAQRPYYPYELSKALGFTSRVIIKHLEVLENARIVETEAGETSLGPERTYYKLRSGFGLSTTILPNSFAVHLRPHKTRITTIRARISIPKESYDVRAVRVLLQEIEKINRQISALEDRSLQLINQRGYYIRKIQEIMEECSWDDESCRLVRQHINPVAVDDRDTSEKPLEDVLNIFEERLSHSMKKDDLDDEGIQIDFE
ncbi:MAG: ArsR family transcriptional regulator [Candidatus Thorarchaeota archaeon]|nr:ArsR family transcriptional regulator [Candidatus Thorarchaeota archaeon]